MFFFWILFVIVGTMAWGSILAAPWVPTLSAQRKLLVDSLVIPPPDPLLRKEGEKSVTIYDLGCGSGSILFEFADRYPNARCIGYDVALLPLFIGMMVKLRHPIKYKNVSLRFGNFFKKHFNDADVVVAFLMQKAYPKFIATLKRELKPNALIAIEAWPLPDIEPIQTIKGEKLVPWYVYRGL
ncbi:MAG: class I SAM-dependent methyltransferase [Patescibacteria group bacterium]